MNRNRQDCMSGNWSGPATQYDPMKDGKAQGAEACLACRFTTTSVCGTAKGPAVPMR